MQVHATAASLQVTFRCWVVPEVWLMAALWLCRFTLSHSTRLGSAGARSISRPSPSEHTWVGWGESEGSGDGVRHSRAVAKTPPAGLGSAAGALAASLAAMPIVPPHLTCSLRCPDISMPGRHLQLRPCRASHRGVRDEQLGVAPLGDGGDMRHGNLAWACVGVGHQEGRHLRRYHLHTS